MHRHVGARSLEGVHAFRRIRKYFVTQHTKYMYEPSELICGNAREYDIRYCFVSVSVVRLGLFSRRIVAVGSDSHCTYSSIRSPIS